MPPSVSRSFQHLCRHIKLGSRSSCHHGPILMLARVGLHLQASFDVFEASTCAKRSPVLPSTKTTKKALRFPQQMPQAFNEYKKGHEMRRRWEKRNDPDRGNDIQ